MSLNVSFSKVCNEFIGFIPGKIASALDIKISNTAKLLFGGAVWIAALTYAVLKFRRINLVSHEKIQVTEKERKTFESTKTNFIFETMKQVLGRGGNQSLAPQGVWSILSQFIQALPNEQQTEFKKKISGKNSSVKNSFVKNPEEFSKMESQSIATLDGEAHKTLTSIEGVKSTNTFEYRSALTLDENYAKTMSTHYECAPKNTASGNTIAKWTNLFELNATLVNPFEIEDKESASLDFFVPESQIVKGQAMTYRGQVQVCQNGDFKNVLDAVVIPYKESKLSWVLILPNKNVTNENFLENLLKPGLFKKIKGDAENKDCQITVPYTKLDINIDLKDSMSKSYKTDDNFNQMSLAVLTDQTKLVSGDVAFTQTGFIEHGPKGVKAEVKTEMLINESYILPHKNEKEPLKIIFDRPFYSFVLDMDNPSQIVTAAYVANPSTFRYEEVKN